MLARAFNGATRMRCLVWWITSANREKLPGECNHH